MGMNQIELKNNGSRKDFYFKNKYLGFAYREIGGHYVFVFSKLDSGAWSDYSLRWIAERLTELNKEWDDHINNNLSK